MSKIIHNSYTDRQTDENMLMKINDGNQDISIGTLNKGGWVVVKIS